MLPQRRIQSDEEEPIPKFRFENTGFVYLVESNGYYKIGYTQYLPMRISHLRGANPHPVTLIHSVEVYSPQILESALLSKFNRWSHHNEWFVKKLPVKEVIIMMNAYGE